MTKLKAVYDCMRRHSDRPMTNSSISFLLRYRPEVVGRCTRELGYLDCAENIGTGQALWKLTDKPYIVPEKRRSPRKRVRNGRGEPQEKRDQYPMPECILTLLWPDPAFLWPFHWQSNGWMRNEAPGGSMKAETG